MTTNGEAFAVRGVVSPLVGRGAELEILDSALARAVEYHAPQVVTILGNQGTGKSRLVAEWAGAIPAPVRVFSGRAALGGGRYHVIARLLRDRFKLHEGDASEAAQDRFRQAVQLVFGDRRVGEVVHFLGGFVDLRFPESPFLRALEDNAQRYDEIGRTVFRRFIEVDAAISPVVLVLDDLQWADDESLQLIDEVTADLAGSRLVLVACARPELLVRRPAFCRRAGDHIRVELRNLDPVDAVLLLHHLLERCARLPDELVADAVAQTGGNPFFLEELVRLFFANGTIDAANEPWRIDGERAAATELPLTVEEAIDARIAALSHDERDVLEKGAVFGSVFWLSALVALSRCEKRSAELGRHPMPPPPPDGSDDGMRAALGRHVDALVERDYLLKLAPEDSTLPGEIELVFKHNLERDLVSKLIDTDSRRRYHRFAAQWLDTRLHGQGRSEEQLEFLAQLYDAGGDRRRAAAAHVAGGDCARARFANEQAVGFYERGLDLLADDDLVARLEALHNLGDVLALSGRADQALVRFQEMLQIAWLLDCPQKAGAAHSRIGRVYRARGDFDPALVHLRMAYEMFEKAGDHRGVASALDDTGMVDWLRGAYPTALQHHQKALAIRRSLGDQRSIALSLANVGRVLQATGRFSAAVDHLRQALEARYSIGDRLGIVQSLTDLGALQEAAGEPSQARTALESALKIATELGDRFGQALVLGRLVDVELGLGLMVEGQDHLTQAQEIAVALGDRLAEAECVRRSAELRIRTNGSEATAHARRAVELAERIGSPLHVGLAQRVMGEVLASAPEDGERQRAESHFRAAVEILASIRNERELARAYLSFAAFRETLGIAQEAAKLRARAQEILGRFREAATAGAQ